MPSKVRIERIEDRFRQDLSELLLREISDPRLHQVFITDVKVDRELAFADIYVSAVEGATRSEEILEGLKSASGFIRRKLAVSIDLRVMPRLRFQKVQRLTLDGQQYLVVTTQWGTEYHLVEALPGFSPFAGWQPQDSGVRVPMWRVLEW